MKNRHKQFFSLSLSLSLSLSHTHTHTHIYIYVIKASSLVFVFQSYLNSQKYICWTKIQELMSRVSVGIIEMFKRKSFHNFISFYIVFFVWRKPCQLFLSGYYPTLRFILHDFGWIYNNGDPCSNPKWDDLRFPFLYCHKEMYESTGSQLSNV